MKLTLTYEFTMPDDEESLQEILDASKNATKLWELSEQVMRPYLKYHEFKNDCCQELFNELDEKVRKVLNEN